MSKFYWIGQSITGSTSDGYTGAIACGGHTGLTQSPSCSGGNIVYLSNGGFGGGPKGHYWNEKTNWLEYKDQETTGATGATGLGFFTPATRFPRGGDEVFFERLEKNTIIGIDDYYPKSPCVYGGIDTATNNWFNSSGTTNEQKGKLAKLHIGEHWWGGPRWSWNDFDPARIVDHGLDPFPVSLQDRRQIKWHLGTGPGADSYYGGGFGEEREPNSSPGPSMLYRKYNRSKNCRDCPGTTGGEGYMTDHNGYRIVSNSIAEFNAARIGTINANAHGFTGGLVIRSEEVIVDDDSLYTSFGKGSTFDICRTRHRDHFRITDGEVGTLILESEVGPHWYNDWHDNRGHSHIYASDYCKDTWYHNSNILGTRCLRYPYFANAHGRFYTGETPSSYNYGHVHVRLNSGNLKPYYDDDVSSLNWKHPYQASLTEEAIGKPITTSEASFWTVTSNYGEVRARAVPSTILNDVKVSTFIYDGYCPGRVYFKSSDTVNQVTIRGDWREVIYLNTPITNIDVYPAKHVYAENDEINPYTEISVAFPQVAYRGYGLHGFGINGLSGHVWPKPVLLARNSSTITDLTMHAADSQPGGFTGAYNAMESNPVQISRGITFTNVNLYQGTLSLARTVRKDDKIAIEDGELGVNGFFDMQHPTDRSYTNIRLGITSNANAKEGFLTLGTDTTDFSFPRGIYVKASFADGSTAYRSAASSGALAGGKGAGVASQAASPPTPGFGP